MSIAVRRLVLLGGCCWLAAPALAAEIHVRFVGDEAAPYESSRLLLSRIVPVTENDFETQTIEDLPRLGKSFDKSFPELEPGLYQILVQTGSKEQLTNGERPGAWFTSEVFELKKDEKKEFAFAYEPFDRESALKAFRGDTTVAARLVGSDQQPLPDVPLELRAFVPFRGHVKVAETRTNSEGRYTFSGLREAESFTLRTADGVEIGMVVAGYSPETMMFPLSAGDAAPELDAVTVDGTRRVTLADLKGRVAVIDFWSVFCPPCQPKMDKLNALYQKHPDWKDKVALVSVSVDDSLALVKQRIDERKWSVPTHLWAGEKGWEADVTKRYGVTSLPRVFILDGQGIIRDANADDVEEAVRKLLEEGSVEAQRSQAGGAAPETAAADSETTEEMPLYRGRLLTFSGEPVAAESVAVFYEGQEVASATTDGEGNFDLAAMNPATTYDLYYRRNRFLGIVQLTSPERTELRLAPTTGDIAPNFPMQVAGEDEPLQLADLRGKFTVLDFAADQCGPCEEVLRSREQMLEQNPLWAEHVNLVAVYLNPRQTDASQVATKLGLDTVRVASVGRQELEEGPVSVYRIIGVPTVMILDPAGKILFRGNAEQLDITPILGKHLELRSVKQAME